MDLNAGTGTYSLIVGARGEDSGSLGVNSVPDQSSLDSGAAFIFSRSGGVWIQEAYLKPNAVGSDAVGDQCGFSVAISQGYALVGCRRENSSSLGPDSAPEELAPDAGAVYVYRRSGVTWTPIGYLKPAAVGASQAGDYFCSAVAAAGRMFVVGSPNEDGSGVGINSGPNEAAGNAGAAYVFVRN